ncbi:GGDEF domain-containing protein [Pseudoalteromonas fenneropenaei]|uniref:GGDEF domain-containing protein n=1 Tax=Pseudoalteromonas fenneropenaei TaxID=1737459 RepID=A0ABV7CN16_9GAMM
MGIDLQQSKLNYRLKRSFKRELLLCIALVVLVTFLSVYFEIEVLESFYDFTRSHENWELDEIVVSLSAICIATMIFTIRRLREIKALHQELALQALTDQLTNLGNRRYAHERLEQMMANCDRYQHILALLFIDLDDFKEINDQYGHQTGDQILKAVSARLVNLVRKNDFVGRYGGDEFIVLIEATQLSEINTAKGRIEALYNANYPLGKLSMQAKFSLGMALYPEEADSAEALLKLADQRMYQEKTAHS